MTSSETSNAKRRKIQDLYWNIHIGRHEEDSDDLTQQAREYLSHVKFKKKFPIVPIGTYLKEVILRKDNKKPETFLQIRKGFSNLEKYGIKLLQAPWRKEFQTIKLYSSFFKHEIEPSIPVVFASGILQLYGYNHEESQDVLKLDEAMSLDIVFKTAFELFLVTIELQVMLEIAKEIDLYTDSITLDEILEARVNTVGDVVEAIDLLFKAKSISLEHKRIKLDRIDPASERENSKSATIKNRIDVIPSLRSRSYPTTTARGHKAVTTKVTHIASTNGVSYPVNRELYGDVEGLSDADLYGVNVSPSYTHHYPQVMGNDEGESDYVSMTGTNEDESYEMMTPQMKNSNGHFELPPPPYDEALNMQYSEKGWVVISSQSPGNDVSSTIPGMSGLNIVENSTVSSSQVKTPSSGTATYASKSSSSNSYKKAEQETAHVKVKDEKLQSQLREFTESSYKSSKDGLSSQRSKRTDGNSVTVGVNGESSSYKPRYEPSNKIMLPPSTAPEAQPQKSSPAVDVKLQAASQGEKCPYCYREANYSCTTCSMLCCERCKGTISSAKCKGKSVHSFIDRNRVLKREDTLTGKSCIQCGKPSSYECSNCSKNLCSDCYSIKASRTGRCFVSFGHNFKPVTSITKDQSREEYTNNNDLQEQKQGCAYCKKEATYECQLCKIKSCSVCQHIKKDSDPCTSSLGHLFKALVSNNLTDETQIQRDLNPSNVCEFCGLIANFICADCRVIICKCCRGMYEREHCPATKKDHFFHVITSQTKIEPKEEPWQCGRCTYSNPSQNKICTMCATSKGVTSIDLPEIGSRRCAHCTFGNAEDARVCGMCGRSLSQSQVESYI